MVYTTPKCWQRLHLVIFLEVLSHNLPNLAIRSAPQSKEALKKVCRQLKKASIVDSEKRRQNRGHQDGKSKRQLFEGLGWKKIKCRVQFNFFDQHYKTEKFEKFLKLRFLDLQRFKYKKSISQILRQWSFHVGSPIVKLYFVLTSHEHSLYLSKYLLTAATA